MNYISLGYFCSIAMDLEQLGLRKESSPFDWLISDFKGVIDAIENHFDGFLAYDNLLQSSDNRAHYKDSRYGFEFYHDFDQRRPLSEQLSAVQTKFDRRIRRFYETIKTPTLFIRYISDEVLVNGKSAELIWIEQNYDRIMRLLKSFHPENDILFIANNGVRSELITIHNVEKGKNDTVCRRPLFDNPALLEYFQSVDFPGREENIARCNRQQPGRRLQKVKNKALSILIKKAGKDYIHPRQYEPIPHKGNDLWKTN